MTCDGRQLSLLGQVDLVASKYVDEVLSTLDVQHCLQRLHLFYRFLDILGHVYDIDCAVSLSEDLSSEWSLLRGLEPGPQVASAVLSVTWHFDGLFDVFNLCCL